MDKNEILDEIFSNDPYGILNVQIRHSSNRTDDDRLVDSFEEINVFFEQNNREPSPSRDNIIENNLYHRLKGLRGNAEKIEKLKPHDRYGLLEKEQKEIESLDDIFESDDMGLLESSEESLFDFKHTPRPGERQQTDFVARRKPCKDFYKYEQNFINIQKDLSKGRRKLVNFNEKQLKPGRYFVENGILLLLENIYDLEVDKFSKEDGRTRIVFENGTESNMKLRSLGKLLFDNGKSVTETSKDSNRELLENFGNITEEDEKSGYIYILRSRSSEPKIRDIQNLYKIGYSETPVEERIKNAENEPTYLMAPVSIVAVYECYNMNTQKFELLIHKFFGETCLNLDIFDQKGQRHTTREWFIAPLDVIEKAIELIINGGIVNYKYDSLSESIVLR